MDAAASLLLMLRFDDAKFDFKIRLPALFDRHDIARLNVVDATRLPRSSSARLPACPPISPVPPV